MQTASIRKFDIAIVCEVALIQRYMSNNNQMIDSYVDCDMLQDQQVQLHLVRIYTPGVLEFLICCWNVSAFTKHGAGDNGRDLGHSRMCHASRNGTHETMVC